MKKEDKNNSSHIPKAIGGATGGVFGIGIGSLMGPEFTVIGASMGSTVGSVFADAVLKHPHLIKKIKGDVIVEELISAKLNKDYYYSALNKLSSFKEARNRSAKRIELLSLEKKRDFMKLTSFKSLNWLDKNLEGIHKHSKLNEIPDVYKKFAEEINQHTVTTKEKISISCECIEAGCVAVLKSLMNPARLGLNIELDFDDTSGVYQIDSISKKNSKYDFVITANAPFYLYGDMHTSIKNYRHCFEIHMEEQVVLRKRTLKKSKHKKIHVFSNSSAEEEFLMKNKIYENTEKFSLQYYEQLVKLVSDLDVGELLIAWEPLATFLSSKYWKIKREEDIFYNWISLFQHKKWGNHSLNRLGEKFKTLFIYEWLYCNKNREYALPYLLNDSNFIGKFREGAGFDIPSIFEKY